MKPTLHPIEHLAKYPNDGKQVSTSGAQILGSHLLGSLARSYHNHRAIDPIRGYAVASGELPLVDSAIPGDLNRSSKKSKSPSMSKSGAGEDFVPLGGNGLCKSSIIFIIDYVL